MKSHIVSAVFDSRSAAEAAIENLRAAGLPDSQISVIHKHDGETTAADGAGEAVDDNKGLLTGLAGGGALGAIAGIAALAIPGVGPFVAAGAIAQTAIGGAALTGAAIGATAGGLAGVLADHGVSDEEAKYYEDRVNAGGVFVSADTTGAYVDEAAIRDILINAGGRSSAAV